MQQFYKGRTNNHLTWVMVDATDFATPESALSAATKIKIYGKLRGATGVNFVSSGTGSLTADIQHVGASALGIYTIALAKADLSDASAAWYDQYIISLSATGAAYQTLVVDGGIDQSAISAYQSRLSDLASYLVAMSGMLSDTHSAAILAASNASEAQSHATLAASRVLLVQSRLSDFTSAVYPSDFSVLQAHLVYLSGVVSDISSRIATTGVSLTSDTMSNLRSAIAAGPAATITASDISDIVSAVWGAKYHAHSLASSFGSLFSVVATQTDGASDILSDIYSNLSDLKSDFQSRVPKRVATDSQLSDLHSDLRSVAIANSGVLSDIYSLVSNINSATLVAADVSDFASAVLLEFSDAISNLLSAIAATNPTASDIASVVWTNTPGTAAASRILQIRNQVSDLQSDFQSRVPKRVATDSQLSDMSSNIYSLLSDLHSDVTVMSNVVSHVYSNVGLLTLNMDGGFTIMSEMISDAQSDLRSVIGANGVLRAGADPTTVPAVNATLAAKVDWITALSRNKITQNSAVQSLRNDGDSADIASAAVSDDGETFTRDEFA